MSQMPMLTAAELDVLEKLAEVSQAFLGLPEHRSYDKREWAEHVHALSNMVMARAAIRAVPGVDWTPLFDTGPTAHYPPPNDQR